MNEREAIDSQRSSKSALGLLLCMALTLSGCALANDTSRVFYLAKRTTHIEPRFYRYMKSDRKEQREARRLGEQAWSEYIGQNPELTPTRDFEAGFVEGFADYLYRGGSGEPPAIPPRGYWNLRFLNQFGKRLANEWYSGFRAGAQDCKARGLRDYWVIPTTLYAIQGDEGPHQELPDISVPGSLDEITSNVGSNEQTSVIADPTPQADANNSITTARELPGSPGTGADPSSINDPAHDLPPLDVEMDSSLADEISAAIQPTGTPNWNSEPPTHDVDVTVPQPPAMVPEEDTDLPPVIEGLEEGEELRVDNSLTIRALQPATKIPVEAGLELNPATVAPVGAGLDAIPSPPQGVARAQVLSEAQGPGESLDGGKPQGASPERMRLIFEPSAPSNSRTPSGTRAELKDAKSSPMEQPIEPILRLGVQAGPMLPSGKQALGGSRPISKTNDRPNELPMTIKGRPLPAGKRQAQQKQVPKKEAPLKLLFDAGAGPPQLPRIISKQDHASTPASQQDKANPPPVRWRIRD